MLSHRGRIRIAVAGLGRIGWSFHCRAIAAHLRQFDLVAVNDPLPERRAEAESEYGCRSFADFEEMIALPGLEAVVVATPTHLHLPMALAALRRGLHVFMEKPMAATLSDAQRMAREAQRRKLILTVYQPNRAVAMFQHLKRVLASGVLGEVYHVRRAMYRYSIRDDWQSLRRYGGGMLGNYGAHALDQVLDLTGRDVKRVFGQLRLVASRGDAEDVVKVLYETREGRLGEVDINQASAGNPYDFQVWGALGYAECIGGKSIRLRYVKGGRLPARTLNRSLASAGRRYPDAKIDFVEKEIAVDGNMAVDVYANLAKAIRRKAPLFVPPRQTLCVMRVMEACRAQSSVRRTPAPCRAQ
jgi:predicted dehydrogenase